MSLQAYQTRRKTESAPRWMKALEMRESRMKYREIAEALGISTNRAHVLVTKAESLKLTQKTK